jgi:subtilisin family serine protease
MLLANFSPSGVVSQTMPRDSVAASHDAGAGILDLVGLSPLMDRTEGRPEILVGLVDGPIATDRPEFGTARFLPVSGRSAEGCSRTTSAACVHGTYVAGILAARRGSGAPGVCPGCTFMVRSVFPEHVSDGRIPAVAARTLAEAVQDLLNAHIHVINLSLSLDESTTSYDRELTAVLSAAARRGVVVVSAAGNQGTLRSTPLTHHPWVIPVAGCDEDGRITAESNFGRTISAQGVRAPGVVVSLAPNGTRRVFRGTSAAAPFVTGAIALLLSLFPNSTGSEVRRAVLESAVGRRHTLIPRLLNASAAYRYLDRLRS